MHLIKDEVATRKRRSENPVQSDTKLAKLDGELKESKAKLHDATIQIHLLKKSTRKLSSALVESGSSTVWHTRKKHWSEYSKRYKRKRKKMVASNVSTAMKFVEDKCFTVRNVVLENKETGEVMSVEEGRVTETTNKNNLKRENNRKNVVHQRQTQLVKPSIS